VSLIFIHGAGCTADAFQYQMEEFPQAHAPNLPGHLSPASPATVTSFAEFIEAYVGEHSPGGAVLCGHSLGGAIAIETALRGVVSLRGLFLIGSGGKLRVAPAILQGLQDEFEATIAQLAEYYFFDATPARLAWAVDSMRRVGPAQTLRDFQACNAFDRLAELSELALPILALTGEADQMTPPKFAQSLADRVPGAQARIVPAAGHFVMIEQPLVTNAAIRAFLHENQ
jgi:pimeloyl-ACP methyl ester carboxylesterase